MSSDERLPPFNLEAEESLLGAALINRTVVPDLVGFVDPSDFYKPIHQHLWAAMIEMYASGIPIDIVTVGEATRAHGSTSELMLTLMNAVPATSNAQRYADIVVQASRRRKLMFHYSNLIEMCYLHTADEVVSADNIRADALMFRGDTNVKGLMSLAEFMDHAEEHAVQGEWLIPHILRPRWRVVIVAGEGVGKAMVLRSLGLHIAAGRDPWNYTQFIEPRRVLYVDAENTDSTILHQVRVSNKAADVDFKSECEDRFHIFRREAGFDLRKRRQQAEFEQMLIDTRPDIVMMGPFYKMFRRAPREDLEQATTELLEVLDDFRTRYNFALMIEAHAAKASGGGYRELNPRGSAVLMGWPEFGITLEIVGNPLPHEEHQVLDVGRFRRDREPADWPDQLERGNIGQNAAWRAKWYGGRNARGL